MKTLSGYIVLIVCFFGLLFLRHELRDYEHIPFLSQDFRKSSLSERQMKERIALVEDEVDSLRSLLENDTKESTSFSTNAILSFICLSDKLLFRKS